jgi:transcriptional regulator with XRE-family HTH domain
VSDICQAVLSNAHERALASTAMRITDISPEDQAARIRAAIGYSGKEAKEVAAELGMSPQSLARRYGAAGPPKGASSLEELHAIASICGVPTAFMEDGFARFNGVQGALDGRLRALEAAQQQQAERFRDALAEVVQAGQDAREEIRNELGQIVKAAVDEAVGQTRKRSEPTRRPRRAPERGA